MSLIEILILLLVIIGIVGAGWILIGVLIFFYGWFENIRIRKKIPDKIKKEVEDARLKRKSKQEDARRRYANDETSTEILQNQRAFNEWMMTEMLKLKEAVNQIGEGLSLILSEAESEESETEDSEEESDSEEQEEEKEIEVPKPIPEPEVKKKAGRPKSF